MAITVTTEKVYDAFYADYREGKAFMHSHTYSGNPLACCAAIEVLKILEEEPIFENARENAAFLTRALGDAFAEHPNVGEIRQIGLIHAIELQRDREKKEPFDPNLRVGYQIYKEALKKGLLLRPLGDVLYFNPPLTITKEELEEAVFRCKAACAQVL